MSVAVEILGFFLGALGLLMLGVTLFNSYWRVSSVYGNVITTSTIFENLWYSCATDSTGVYNCWEFPSLLALSGTIQACRALMITGIVLSSLSVLLGIIGLRCTQIGSLTSEGKARLAAASGALHILAGICGMVTISWYASNITRQFFDPLYAGTKYELGPALYLGWSASLLCIIGGVLLCGHCCCSSKRRSTSVPYKASQTVVPSMDPACLPPGASDNTEVSFDKYGKNAYV
ncbi:claudin-15 [Phascolarctos cinereus]|uniref:Claudin n=1 Tax=Phascolarctos cinereus TaxID=38626 RepID=A0A6P5IJ21_PHACI|nr:claudin-15 isoform X2 [Phascolarctos cinereus]